MSNNLDKILKFDSIPEDLINLGTKVSYKKDTIIIRSGEIPKGFYILTKGKMITYSETANGKIIIHALIEAFWTIGDGHTINSKVMFFNFKCITDCEFVYIRKNELDEGIKTNNNISSMILQSVVTKFDVFCKQVLDYTTLDSENRTCNFLLEMTTNYGVEINGKIKIDYKIKQEDISNIIGVNRTTIFRIINKLIDLEVIEKKNGYYYIIDLKVLKDLSV